MAAAILLIVLAVGVLLARLGYLLRRRNDKTSVQFNSADEMNTVSEVVWWAEDQFAADDPRGQVLRSLSTMPTSPFHFLFVGWPVSALAVLAPFIDQVIAGQGPPWPLPAEYDDRAEVLGAFKARMQAKGVWPREVRAGPEASDERRRSS